MKQAQSSKLNQASSQWSMPNQASLIKQTQPSKLNQASSIEQVQASSIKVECWND
jgi:hypothetical protein